MKQTKTQIPLRPIMLVLTLAFSGMACAEDFKLYVSEKISHSKMKIKDSTSRSLPPLSPFAFDGSNEKDNVIGSKTAIGFVLPVNAIRGNIRAEFEFGFNEKANFDIVSHPRGETVVFDTKIKAQTYFINAYYDLDTGTAFTPYIGIGAGIANIKKSKTVLNFSGINITSPAERENNFTWNTSLGGTYAFNKNLSFDISYRYTDLGDLKGTATFGNFGMVKTKAKISSYEVLAGIRYSF
jgi:opacity protein-like surface antigen